MRPFASADASQTPLHVLFPEEYRRTCRMIVQDFALVGTLMVGTVVGLVSIFG